jgi:signal transduction histidine kinase
LNVSETLLTAQNDSPADTLAILSHELKNPLSALAMMSDLLSQTQDPRARVQVLERLSQLLPATIQHMLKITSDCLEIHPLKPNADLSSYPSTPVKELVEGVIRTYALSAEKKSIHLTPRLSDEGAQVLCVPHQITQVLANLVCNALKFTPSGGEVWIHTQPLRHHVRFYVQDTGPGIPADEIASLFHKFWRGQNHKMDGSGLGLFISKKILDSHHQRIWLDTTQSLGSTFCFELARAL